MCLRLNPYETPETATKIASEDITCYKILKGYNDINNEVFMSLYQNFKYVIGERYQQTNIDFLLNSVESVYHRYNIYEVYEAFHSFKYKETTLFELDEYSKRLYSKFEWSGYSKQRYSKIVAVKCTIPKGSKYVETDAFYASDAIILNEIIGEYKNKMKIIV